MVHLIRTAWSGTSGGPGVTQLAVDYATPAFGAMAPADAQAAVNAVRAYWQSLITLLPDEITLTVSPVVDYYLSNSGVLSGSTSAATPPASVQGTSAGVFSMATGPKINLNTGAIANGRRVRGSIYIVPGASSTQGANGMTLGAAKTTMNAAGVTLLAALASAALDLKVWSRPVPAGKPHGPRDGFTNKVIAMEANEKLAILRGRRD